MSSPDHSLLADLNSIIERDGPLPVSVFMELCLHHPTHGYYTRGEGLGQAVGGPAAGDFLTAPEASPLFGELIGLWLAQSWLDMGSPATLDVVELGPGTGRLMGDALGAIRQAVPAMLQAPGLELHFVEASPALQARQQATLAPFASLAPSAPLTMSWHRQRPPLRDRPLLLIANEFLDALPIRQYVKLAGRWHERLVGLKPGATAGGPAPLAFHASPPLPAPQALVPPPLLEADDGAIYERAAAAEAVLAECADHLTSFPGRALFIDYGEATPAGQSTLQAVRQHRYAPLLEAPGTADLSAHVPFSALKDLILNQSGKTGAIRVDGPLPQGAMLETLGIRLREQALLARLATLPEEAERVRRTDALRAGVSRLVDGTQMGDLFKALCLSHAGLPPPAGFPSSAGSVDGSSAP